MKTKPPIVDDSSVARQIMRGRIVTVSVGVCSGIPVVTQTPAPLVPQAEHVLYAAKNAGRDRVFRFNLSRQVAVPV